MNIILKKWIEPYVLLETIKKDCKLIKVLKFDGFSKNNTKKEFLEDLRKNNHFGLYMKNVNNFYVFEGKPDIRLSFGLNNNDIEQTEDIDKPFDLVDMGKSEAGFINL